MKIRAAIFDVYTTILEVGAPPADANRRWQQLCEETLEGPPPFTRTEFATRTSQVIARLHQEARGRGIQWPEVLWPAVVLEVLPDLARLSARRQEEFHLRLMQLGRTLRLADGAAECLRWLHRQGVVLGIASNSQAYTLHELTAGLESAGLNLSMFDPEIRFWSFEHGFSKPDPHVFRTLTTKLKLRGIGPAETLMVGDRLDNDITPARLHGCQTWQVTPAAQNQHAGNWRALLAWLKDGK